MTWGATVFETLKAGKLYEVSMICHGKKYQSVLGALYIYILYVLYMHIIWVCVWIRHKSVVMDTRELEFIQPQHRVTLKRSFTDRSWWTLVYLRVCPVFGQHTKSYSWLHTVYMFIYWIQCKYEKHRESICKHTLPRISLHDITWHQITIHCIALHCITYSVYIYIRLHPIIGICRISRKVFQ